MKIRKGAAVALCCKSWGISADEFEAKAKAGLITFKQVMEQITMELYFAPPFTAEAIQERVFPGSKRERRRHQQKKQSSDAFEMLLAMAKRNQK